MENVETISTRPKVLIRHPWLAMVGMLIGAFVGMLSETSLNIALPQLMSSMGVNIATVQWLVTGYMLVIGIVLPFTSLLTKWFSTRQVVTFALLDFIVGTILAACAPNFTILLIGRMIQGIATGLILPLMFTVATLIFPPYRLGLAMGICALVIMFAPAVGPTLTGLILSVASWRWIFWLFMPFLIIAFIFAVINLENVGTVTRPHVDLLSVFASIVGFASLVTSISFIAALGLQSPVVIGLFIIAIIFLAFYIYRQLKIDQPILNLKIFSKADFTKGALCVMLDFGIILSAMYLLPQYLQNGVLLPVAITGMIMLPGGIINALVSAVAGKLYDNHGAKRLVSYGFIIIMIGALMLIFTSAKTSIVYIIGAHIILMIGCPLVMSPSQTHALSSLSPNESADGSTILNTLQQVIGAIATALATSFLNLGQKLSTGETPANRFTTGFHFGLCFTFILALLGLFITLRMTSNHPSQSN